MVRSEEQVPEAACDAWFNDLGKEPSSKVMQFAEALTEVSQVKHEHGSTSEGPG